MYLPYKQCLPGCFAVNSSTATINTTLTTDTNEYVNITSDIQCEVYSHAQVVAGRKPEALKDSTKTPGHFIHKSLEQGKN